MQRLYDRASFVFVPHAGMGTDCGLFRRDQAVSRDPGSYGIDSFSSMGIGQVILNTSGET